MDFQVAWKREAGKDSTLIFTAWFATGCTVFGKALRCNGQI